MNKILTLAVLLQMVLTASAQSIEGKWKTNLTEDGISIPCTMTFNAKGGVTLHMTAKQSDPQIGTVHIAIKGVGTYKVDGKELTVTMEPKKSKAEVTRIEFTNSLKVAMVAQPGLDKQVIDMMNDQLRGDVDNMVKDMPMTGKITITELTDKKMTLSDGKNTFVLTR